MQITIRDLELWTHIGITRKEQSTEQRVLATIVLTCKGVEAGKTDQIEDTVNYENIVKLIKTSVTSEHHTLEKFGDQIIKKISTNPNIEHISLMLKKYILPGTKFVSVLINMDKEY